MRSALLLVICACGAPPPAMPANRLAIEPCDEAMWRGRAASRMRERLGDRDLIVTDACYGVARVLVMLPGAIVAGTVNDHQLTRVVTRETSLWERPGNAPLPGILVEPGTVVTGSGDWLSVAPNLAIEATGYVPARATGLLWSAEPPPGTDGKRLGRYVEVVSEPVAGAAHLANISGNEPVFDQIEAGPAGWLHVTASDESVRVTGWVAPAPPPSHSALLHDYDFSDDVIEGDLVRPEGEDGAPMGPLPPHATGCIRTRPDDTGHIIGLVTGDLAGTAEGDGWVRLELPTPWGQITGHAREQ